ncbi:VOC family protein [Aquisalibacillus elongatus]|uniref:Catechol 2,3-dioxygenase-like lactoylglutathione lyase family enzyme n=1 Tax=Aquisalibacillus elongatus TaxID=485577 RepID=A0A3N5C2G2_9BACI|nr:VOC family protein [Aquisalibacillus elongatus]RPF52205.1 catechol 2,3-dioxygenase-like lactoylglutathione lyase family enzyme [Aquisalibacillus elongatus]
MQVSVISVGVHDMDQALSFYSEKLGIEVGSKKYYPEIVELKSSVPIILFAVDRKTEIEYEKDSYVAVGLNVESANDTIKDLKAKGVDLIFEEPVPFPLGMMTAAKDPSGNVVEFLEFNN